MLSRDGPSNFRWALQYEPSSFQPVVGALIHTLKNLAFGLGCVNLITTIVVELQPRSFELRKLAVDIKS